MRGTCLAPLTDNSKDIDWIARFHHHQVARSKSIAVSTMRRHREDDPLLAAMQSVVLG